MRVKLAHVPAAGSGGGVGGVDVSVGLLVEVAAELHVADQVASVVLGDEFP